MRISDSSSDVCSSDLTRITADGVSTALGRYDFSGVIDAYSAAFTGAWNSGPGRLARRFYRHPAQTYEADFNIKDPAAGTLTGGTIAQQTAPSIPGNQRQAQFTTAAEEGGGEDADAGAFCG